LALPWLCIIFNSALNLDLPDWYELFQKKPLVDALLDRLQHRCIILRVSGPSLRSEPGGAPGARDGGIDGGGSNRPADASAAC
jgi:hypothetical protein